MKAYKLYFDPDVTISGSQLYATNSFGMGYDLIHQIDRAILPPSDFVFDCIQMEVDAARTDFMSISSPGGHLVVSDRVRRVFDAAAISKAAFFPAKIRDENGYLQDPYWLIWIYGNEFDNIDFSKTKFELLEGLVNRVAKDLPPMTKEQLLDEFSKSVRSASKAIRVKGSYQFIHPISNLDLFCIGRFDKWVYISENLRNRLVALGATGVEFIEVHVFE